MNTLTLKDILKEVQDAGLTETLEGLTYEVGHTGAYAGDLAHACPDGFSLCEEELLQVKQVTLAQLQEENLCETCVRTLGVVEVLIQSDGWETLDNPVTVLVHRTRVLEVTSRLRDNVGGATHKEDTGKLRLLLEGINDELEYTTTNLEPWRKNHLQKSQDLIKDLFQSDAMREHLRKELQAGRGRDDTPYLVTWRIPRRSVAAYARGATQTQEILLAWDARDAHDESSLWLIVPRYTIETLEKTARSISPDSLECVPAPEGALLETTLGLWGPRGTGELEKIEAALQAATRLHA